MDSHYWNRVEALFSEVSALPPAERDAALDAARHGAPDIVAEVESLLASTPASEQFLSTPWAPDAATTPATASPLTGRRIGPFRLLEPIGTGGMGVVYRARRDEADFAQQVAIKIVTAAGWPGFSQKRFHTERQLLATLRHPHIVTLMDGGTTDDGLAYLVMEYVDGLPITEYCRARGLTLGARLDLFRQLCAAVQHAHQHAIVHRDLKPGNVLVTADGIPKVLDFGIARLLDDPTASGGDVTAAGLFAATPNYASPEQVRGLAPTTADDVYALGILLFELLAGRTPYDTTGRPLDDVLRIVVEEAPPRPSSVAGGAIDAARLRGNLDAIVLKAIEKDPARRYGSAQELADDLTRHLRGAVVAAREPSLTYVLATLARRHRAVVAASVVSLVAIVSALGVSLVQTRRATEARDRADRPFQEVRRLANTLLFDIHDAVQPLAGSTPVRQRIVAEALTYLEGLEREVDDTALRTELGRAYYRVGTVQGNPTGPYLGDREGAIASYRRAAALLQHAAPDSAEAAVELTRVQFALIAVLSATGRTAEAAVTAREAETTAQHLLARDSRNVEARRQLGSAYFWRATLAPTGEGPDESIPLWQQAAEVFGTLLAETPNDAGSQRNVALVAKYLGEQYRRTGNLAAAVAQHRRALEIDERRAAAAPANRQAQLDVALDWASLGGLLREQGELADAAASLEKSLAVRRRLASEDPRDDHLQGRLAHAHALLGRVYGDMSRTGEAVEHLRTAVRISAARPSTDVAARFDHATYLVDTARAEQQRGRTAAACAEVARAAALGVDAWKVTDADASRRSDLLRDIADLQAVCGEPGGPAPERHEPSQPPSAPPPASHPTSPPSAHPIELSPDVPALRRGRVEADNVANRMSRAASAPPPMTWSASRRR